MFYPSTIESRLIIIYLDDANDLMYTDHVRVLNRIRYDSEIGIVGIYWK